MSLISNGMGLMFGGGGNPGLGIRITVNLALRFPQVKEEIKDAVDGIIMGVAEDIIMAGKRNVHRVTGTLARSIKADRPGDVRDRTEEATNRDLAHPIPRPSRGGSNQFGRRASLAVGGTTFYAIYEELLHPYIWPAVDEARAKVDTRIRAQRI